MEGMASSVWSYQESIDELKQRLLYTTFELESARINVKEEMRKNEENIKQLLHLLKIAYQERDEARDQLQKLLNKVIPSSPTQVCTYFPQIQPESPPMKPTKANSGITESDSLSETYNHHSYGSSPVEPFFDTVSSPDPSNMKMVDTNNFGVPRQPLLQEYNFPISRDVISPENGSPSMCNSSPGKTNTDRASSSINNLVKGKPLPQKGRLLQSVMEAGPLLQTLLVAGPLPRWRNPPPLQHFQIPPVSIRGSDSEMENQKPVVNPNYAIQNPLSSSHHEIPSGTSQIYSTSMLNFSTGSGSCLKNGCPISAGINMDVMHIQIPTGKRQRFL